MRKGYRATCQNFLLMLMISLLFVFAIPFFVSADFGPKPFITIIVDNPPDGQYYLDLLVLKNDGNSQLDDREQYDQTKLKLLDEYDEGGWTPALVQGTTIPLFGELTGQRLGQVMVHTFSYVGTPDRFKIIIVTPDNQINVSPMIIRETFQMSLRYDYLTGEIAYRSVVMSYVLQILSTLIPTLVIEGLLLLAFGFSLKRNWLTFLLVNVGTQILLTAVLGTAAIKAGMFAAYLLAFPVELAIMVIESIAFAFLLKEHRKRRRVGYAIVANLLSLTAGLVIMSL